MLKRSCFATATIQISRVAIALIECPDEDMAAGAATLEVEAFARTTATEIQPEHLQEASVNLLASTQNFQHLTTGVLRITSLLST